jgi:hypothetical protein
MECILQDILPEILSEIIVCAGGRGVFNLARTSRGWWARYEELLAVVGLTLVHGYHKPTVAKPTNPASTSTCENTQTVEYQYHGVLRSASRVWSIYMYGEHKELLTGVCDEHTYSIHRYYMMHNELYCLKHTMTDRGVLMPHLIITWWYKNQSSWEHRLTGRYNGRHWPVHLEKHTIYVAAFDEEEFIGAQLAVPSRFALLCKQKALP